MLYKLLVREWVSDKIVKENLGGGGHVVQKICARIILCKTMFDPKRFCSRLDFNIKIIWSQNKFYAKKKIQKIF